MPVFEEKKNAVEMDERYWFQRLSDTIEGLVNAQASSNATLRTHSFFEVRAMHWIALEAQIKFDDVKRYFDALSQYSSPQLTAHLKSTTFSPRRL